MLFLMLLKQNWQTYVIEIISGLGRSTKQAVIPAKCQEHDLMRT